MPDIKVGVAICRRKDGAAVNSSEERLAEVARQDGKYGFIRSRVTINNSKDDKMRGRVEGRSLW